LIPGFDEVKQRCLAAGALGGGISGSGPSIFMLSKDVDTAHTVGAIMREVYTALNIDHKIYVTTLNHTGVKITEV
jgi:homoserine kinase